MNDRVIVHSAQAGLPKVTSVAPSDKPNIITVEVVVSSGLRSSNTVSFTVVQETVFNNRFAKLFRNVTNGVYSHEIHAAHSVSKVWIETIEGRSDVVELIKPETKLTFVID